MVPPPDAVTSIVLNAIEERQDHGGVQRRDFKGSGFDLEIYVLKQQAKLVSIPGNRLRASALVLRRVLGKKTAAEDQSKCLFHPWFAKCCDDSPAACSSSGVAVRY